MSEQEFNYIYDILKQKYGTQQKIAEALGIDRSYLSKLKTGADRITRKLAVRLRRLAGVKPRIWVTSSNTLGIPDEQIVWVIK